MDSRGLAQRGIEPALPLDYVIVFNETVGAVMLAVGFFTCVFAVMSATEMAVIVSVHLPKFGWTLPGYEYALTWGAIVIALAVRGGGAYSVDCRPGWEL